MFERTVSRRDLDRLRLERETADRDYNDALTRLDEAIRPLREPPEPAAPGSAEDPGALAALTDLPPPDAAAGERGWRRWLRRLVAPVVAPAFDRQTAFNRALVGHLDELAAARRREREASGRLIAFLREELGALLAFESRLVQYAQRITPYVDTKDREVAGLMRRINEDNRMEAEGLARRVDGVGAGLETLSAAQQALEESFALLEASARILKRELHRLRTAPPGDAGGADGEGRARPAGEAPVAGGSSAPAGGSSAPAGVSSVPAGVSSVPAGGSSAPAGGSSVPAGGSSAPAGFAPAEDGDTEDDGSAYIGFEDVFRGRHEDIAERQRSYLRYFEGVAEVVDLGCGRGEFLELLREQGIPARGVDANPEMVARGAERGLDVARADALGYLRALPDASVGGLFSAQVVEHLEPRYLARLLAAMHRVLRPGGRAVIETINPASWSAFFSAYLRDVTHRQPLHPDTLQHLLRAAGFTAVEVVYRSPPPAASRLQRLPVDPALAATPAGAALCELAGAFNRNVDRLNGLLFAEQDYAAIATRQG